MSAPVCDQLWGFDAAPPAAVDGLSEVLKEPVIGRECFWAGRLLIALDELVISLRRRMVAAEAPAKRPCRTVPFSHTRSRPAHQIRQELFSLLEETCALRRRVDQVLEAFASPPYTAFSEILEHGARLLRALETHDGLTETMPPEGGTDIAGGCRGRRPARGEGTRHGASAKRQQTT